MPLRTRPERCGQCGRTLDGAPRSWDTLAAENRELRHRIAELEDELHYWNAGPFLASKDRKHFHRSHCKWVREIPGRNLIEVSSHEESVAAGYRPCKTCKS